MMGKLKGVSTFLLNPSPFPIPTVQAVFLSPAYGFPTWSPSPQWFSTVVILLPRGFFFFVIITRMLLISNGYRSGMVIKSYNAQPPSPTKNSPDQNVNSTENPCSSHSLRCVLNSGAIVIFTF